MITRSQSRQLQLVLSVIGIVALIGANAWLYFFHIQPEKSVVTSTCPKITMAQQITRADLVVTAKVVTVVANGKLAEVLLSPLHIYKGQVTSATLRVVANPSTAGAGLYNSDIHFASDQPPYLLFLRQQSDGRYFTSKCDGSRLLGEGLTEMEKTALPANTS